MVGEVLVLKVLRSEFGSPGSTLKLGLVANACNALDGEILGGSLELNGQLV